MRRIITAFTFVLFLGHPAYAAPIDNLTVIPLAGPASCYAGTSGTDHVMFLRANTSAVDCDVFSGGSSCLNRREFAGDGPNGRPVSLNSVKVQRPSVTGAGDIVGFSDMAFNACLMETASEDSEGCLGRDFFGVDPDNISINPAGTALALTQLDGLSFQGTPFVSILDPVTLALIEPTYQVATPEPGGNALQVDTVEFTVDGDYLIADALNPVSLATGIYAVSRTTGATVEVVPPVAGLRIRNPALAQTSDDHMVFEAFDTTTGVNYLIASDLLSGQWSIIDSGASSSYYPSYTGDDSAIVYTVFDSQVSSFASLDIQPVDADRITAIGSSSRWLTDGGVGEVYRRGTWDGTLENPADCAVMIVDTDGDGVADDQDNCTLVANADQRDTNGDGFGNVCDPDLDNNNIVNFFDVFAFSEDFNTVNNGDADFNNDGFVNFFDFIIVPDFFLLPPGPSGIAP